jgi:flagellar motor switch protein FliG
MNREGMERSAVLLLSLGEEAAAQVFRQLSPFEVAELGKVMRDMGPLSRDRVQAILDEYEQEAARQTGFGADAEQFLDAALTRAVGDEHARALLSRIAGDSADLQKLAWKEPAEIAALLRGEHPQVAAAVLARLDRAQAASTLEWLPQEMRGEVLRRLSEWQGAPPEALREVDEWLLRSLEKDAHPTDGGVLAAELLSRLSPAAREEVEAGLMQDEPVLLNQLKAHQLELNDLARLAGETRTRFFKAVPGRTLLLALKGADPELIERLCSHMPGTAARRLRDDLDALGAVRLGDIETAQAETVRLLRNLAAQGQIELDRTELAHDAIEQ